MSTYIMLANWTDQGARNVKDSPRRLDAAKKALEEVVPAADATVILEAQVRQPFGQRPSQRHFHPIAAGHRGQSLR